MIKCGDCGKKKGELHGEGCDIERCPKCSGQLLTCTCDWTHLLENNKFVFKEGESKRYKRSIIETVCDM